MKTLTLQEILEIVDKNGFDWFGFGGVMDYNIRKEDHVVTDGVDMFVNGDQDFSYRSLADLFTNKSFLEALVKAAEICKYKVETCKKGMGCSGNGYNNISCVSLIQNKLIRSLTEKEDNHCKIITEFLGQNKC